MDFKRIVTTALATLTLIACATNPATGRRELSLVSPEQERQLGQQAHQQVIDQFGIYDEYPRINQMVERVGQRIASVSDMPDLDWHFEVLDSPMLNAMALPGGYIYITRGMLERMNTEDELAGVLGHEIAHVTARHAAQRISQAQLAQIGLVVGAIAAGPEAAQQYGDLAQLGLGLLFQRYSRQHESQADLLGTAYMAEAGYNPHGAAEMLRALGRLRSQEVTKIDQYFQSHPDPDKRVGDVLTQINDIEGANPQIVTRDMERAPFVRDLEGMITGKSTMGVVIKNNTVYEKEHGIVLSYPEGYMAVSGFGGLFQIVPDENSRVQNAVYVDAIPLERIQTRDVQGALRRQFQEMGLNYQTSYQARTRDGSRIPIDLWAGRTQSGTIAVETAHWIDDQKVVVFTEISPSASPNRSPLANTFSIIEIDPLQARRAEPPRLLVGQASRGANWSDLARRATGDPGQAAELAAINGFDANTPVPAGLAVKLPQQIVERD